MARSRSNSASSGSSNDSNSGGYDKRRERKERKEREKREKKEQKQHEKEGKKHEKEERKERKRHADRHAEIKLPANIVEPGVSNPALSVGSGGMPLMPSFAQSAQYHHQQHPQTHSPFPSTTTPGAPNAMFPNFPQPGHSPTQPSFPQPGHSPNQPSFPQSPAQRSPEFPDAQSHGGQEQQQHQQPYAHQQAPPSGHRVALQSGAATPGSAYPSFPVDPKEAGAPPCHDADGVSPVYVGSAIFPDSVHPCKIAPQLTPPCRVPYGGAEYEHIGRYDLLPITADMEWVRASKGQIPHGRRPVAGGYEKDGGNLYHALCTVNSVKVPGKCGEHLRGANVAFGGQEIYCEEYELLCWR